MCAPASSRRCACVCAAANALHALLQYLSVQSFVNTLRRWSVYIYLRPRRRLPACFDWPPAIHFGLSRHTSSLRGCPTMLVRVRSSSFVLSTARRLILEAALAFRFTNTLHALPLGELNIARIPRTHTLCANAVSSSTCQANSVSSISFFFFFLSVTRSASRAGQREHGLLSGFL